MWSANMEAVMGIDQFDHTKLQQLDEMLLVLDQSSGGAPAEMADLVSNASSALRSLRNGLKCHFSKHVSKLARDGKWCDSRQALNRLFPDQGVCIKRHTEMPEILLLQKNISEVVAGDNDEVLKQLDERTASGSLTR